MKTILVVDSDIILLQTVVGLLKSQSSLLEVQSASSLQAALGTLAGQPGDVVITGMHMPEMDTYEILSIVDGRYPKTRVFVITNKASEMLRTRIRQMAAAVHFDQALDISMLTKRLFTELQIDYGGQLRGVSLPAFLQMMELEGRSCRLHIRAKGKVGSLDVQDGRLVAAKMNLLTGRPAAVHIMTWENVVIDIDYASRDVAHEISSPLMNLLLESGRIADERVSQRLNQRKHDRYDCLVGVDYDISDWTYQCNMRDISEGGAYIETEHAIKVGQRLIMSLSSPILDRACAIQGTVVRRDPKGVGVHFDKLSLQQTQIIRSLMESRCAPTSKHAP